MDFTDEQKLQVVTRALSEWHKNKHFQRQMLSNLSSYLGLESENLLINKDHAVKSNVLEVSVEWVSGSILIPQLVISQSETWSNLFSLIATALPHDPLYHHSRHRIFRGHGGTEITFLDPSLCCGDILTTGITLVVLPGCIFIFTL